MYRYPHGKPSKGWECRLIDFLLATLPLKDFGRSVPARTLAQVVLWISCARATFTSASYRLTLDCCDETLRKAVHNSLPNARQRDHMIAESLRRWRNKLSKANRKRGFVVAIDLHHQPYYGMPLPEIFRGKAKFGTKQFWSIASAAIVWDGERLTLAIEPVNNNRMEEALARLWPKIHGFRIKVRCLLLDRGFFGAPVVRWLTEQRVNFLMPLVRRGNAEKGTGSAPLFARTQNGFDVYQWQTHNHGAQADVNVAVSHREGKTLVYAYLGNPPHVAWCEKTYRHRFGIESSYRQSRQSLGWTTSHNPEWRYLLIYLSLLIRNFWLLATTPHRPRHRPLPLTLEKYTSKYALAIEAAILENSKRPP